VTQVKEVKREAETPRMQENGVQAGMAEKERHPVQAGGGTIGRENAERAGRCRENAEKCAFQSSGSSSRT